MESESIVERVAKALCAADGMDWDAQSDPMTSGNGDDNTIAYLHSARAAISAMREPTEEMVSDGWLADDEGGMKPRDCWALMIDSALK